MDTKFSSRNDGNGGRNDPPPVGRQATVLHEGRARKAYRDSEGRWRDFHDGNVLRGEVRFLKVD